MLTTSQQVLSASTLVEKQRAFFDTGATRPVKFRIEQLKNFKKVFLQYEEKMYEALKKDFNKPVFESYTSELGLILEEIGMMIKNLEKAEG